MPFGLEKFKIIVQMNRSESENADGLEIAASSAAEGILSYLYNVSSVKGNQYKLDDKVISQLPEEFREQSTKHRHLGAYVSALPIDEIGIPEYKSFISRAVDTQEKRNLVYPVGGGVFIHVVHDPEDTRDYLSLIHI